MKKSENITLLDASCVFQLREGSMHMVDDCIIQSSVCQVGQLKQVVSELKRLLGLSWL